MIFGCAQSQKNCGLPFNNNRIKCALCATKPPSYVKIPSFATSTSNL
jgi:hypothetical protein